MMGKQIMNIMLLQCRHLEDRSNHVLWSVGFERASEIGDLLQRLQTADIPTKDISGIEAVQVCIHGACCVCLASNSALA